MWEIECQFKEENENIKKLFYFNGDETQIKHLKEVFSNFNKNSKNGANYFARQLYFFSYMNK